jgi:hypothetical protein
MQICDHASRRAQRRSVSQAALSVLMRFADIERPNVQGRLTLGLSARALTEAYDAGYTAMVVDEARTTALVVALDDTVVTVLRGKIERPVRKSQRRSRGRTYRWRVR